MYVKTAKLVPFAVMGERYGAIGDIVRSSSQFHSDARELQPAPLADGKFKLAPAVRKFCYSSASPLVASSSPFLFNFLSLFDVATAFSFF